MSDKFVHVPVLLEECIDGLNIDANGLYLDGTVGGAGHSREIASRLKDGRLFCLDKDPDALAAATERLKGLNATVIEGDFRNAAELLPNGIELSGALLDLGVSSHQLDDSERGFSYREDAPLDMRMSQSGKSARDVVNGYELNELTRIFRDYADESNAYIIAKKIVAERALKPIETTAELASIVASALPPAVRRKEKHPAKKVFQAIRIEVNDEMGALAAGIEAIFKMLKTGGRFCIITFHSIEDRLVKTAFADLMRGCTCPPDFPVCVCGNKPKARQITRKPIIASEHECEENRRSHSAKLRIIEKI